MFRLSAITDEFSPDFTRALQIARELNLREVEIHTLAGQDIAECAPGKVDWLAAALKQQELAVSCVATSVFLRCHLDDNQAPIPRLPGYHSIEGSHADHLQALSRALETAARLSAQCVRIFGFWGAGDPSPATYHQAAKILRRAAHLARSLEIVLALENCPHTSFGWGERTARLVSMVDSPWLKMLWDPCSGLRAGEPDILAPFPAIQPHLVHVHAKDILVDPALKRGRRYVPIGQGQLPWPQLLSLLLESGYTGAISLEPHHLGPDGTRESAARESVLGMQAVINKVTGE